MGQVHVDMCMQERLIPNNMATVKLTVHHNDVAFCPLEQSTSGKKYKVVIEDASLEARRVKLASGEQLWLEKAWYISNQFAPIWWWTGSNYLHKMCTATLKKHLFANLYHQLFEVMALYPV